jgi:iron-sulfur cluster assembly protein
MLHNPLVSFGFEMRPSRFYCLSKFSSTLFSVYHYPMLTTPIHITKQALEAIERIRSRKSIAPTYHLRFGMRGSGCSGEFYVGFDTAKEADRLFEYENLTVLIDKAQLMYLVGITLDFVENEQGQQGFVFRDSTQDTSLDK